MKYSTAKAFRHALETRLNAVALGDQAALIRMRRTVVFDRLLVRLFLVAPDDWIVKGGYALDLRLGERARATRDLDLAHLDSADRAITDLATAAAMELTDFFGFSASTKGRIEVEDEEPVIRMSVAAELDGRRFETVTVVIGFRASFPANPELLSGHDLLAFADLAPITIPVIPLEQHLAEKLHAYSRRYSHERLNTRVKDLIDIVLISTTTHLNSRRLRIEIDQAFHDRATHALPPTLPRPPEAWTNPYRALALEVGLAPDISDGYQMAAQLLDPVLTVAIIDEATWNPSTCLWRRP